MSQLMVHFDPVCLLSKLLDHSAQLCLTDLLICSLIAFVGGTGQPSYRCKG